MEKQPAQREMMVSSNLIKCYSCQKSFLEIWNLDLVFHIKFWKGIWLYYYGNKYKRGVPINNMYYELMLRDEKNIINELDN